MPRVLERMPSLAKTSVGQVDQSAGNLELSLLILALAKHRQRLVMRQSEAIPLQSRILPSQACHLLPQQVQAQVEVVVVEQADLSGHSPLTVPSYDRCWV